MERIVRAMMDLIASEVCGKTIDKTQYALTDDALLQMYKLAKSHDLAHLVGDALIKNGLIANEEIKAKFQQQILLAFYRYEKIQYELGRLSKILNEAQIPFIPLKGAVIRQYYPESWFRTSCDIDILVHKEDLEKAIRCLSVELKYILKERTTHDVSLFAPNGVHIELHFDLVEEGRANNAIKILSDVWEYVALCENSGFCYEMFDEFFYFYHIAHMAKHFENGGCGIRPFVDLVILEHKDGFDFAKRNALLDHGGLLQFAEASRRLSRIWFEKEPWDELSEQMQNYILHGGSYGTTDNRVAVHQKQGKIQYILSRMFIPYSKLKRYYPILEKHKWLMPIMQVRRWFMLLDPSIMGMAKREISVNGSISGDKIRDTQALLKNVGL